MYENEQYGARTCYNMQRAEKPEVAGSVTPANGLREYIMSECTRLISRSAARRGRVDHDAELDLDDGILTLNELMGLPPFDDRNGGAGAA